MDPLNSSEFESLELLLEAPEVPDDELAVAGGGGELVGPVLVAGHDLDGADLVLVGGVEDGVGHLALPGAVLGLEHGLGAELGLALVGLLVLLEPAGECHLARAVDAEDERGAVVARRDDGGGRHPDAALRGKSVNWSIIRETQQDLKRFESREGLRERAFLISRQLPRFGGCRLNIRKTQTHPILTSHVNTVPS